MSEKNKISSDKIRIDSFKKHGLCSGIGLLESLAIRRNRSIKKYS